MSLIESQAGMTNLIPCNSQFGGDYDAYSFGQSDAEVIVSVPLPEGVTSKMLCVEITTSSINVSIKGKQTVLSGQLFKPVKSSECMWSIEDKKLLVITLVKTNLNYEEWWPCVTVNERQIDMKAFVPPSKHISEMDESAQATIAKMMFDQRQKMQGLPTSDDTRIQSLLREELCPPYKMRAIKNNSLLGTLERPDSMENWLLGTQYSQKYMTKLRFETAVKTIPSLNTTMSNRTVHSSAAKTKSPTKRSIRDRKAVPVRSPRSPRAEEEEEEEGRRGEGELAGCSELPLTTAKQKTSRRHKASPSMTALTRDDQTESYEDQDTRDLLIESYYRMRDTNSYTGSFPALLTPYQRSLWTYKAVKEPKDELTVTSLQQSHDASVTFPFKYSNENKGASFGDRCAPQLAARVHPPSGPAAFSPTPTSFRWKMIMRLKDEFIM